MVDSLTYCFVLTDKLHIFDVQFAELKWSWMTLSWFNADNKRKQRFLKYAPIFPFHGVIMLIARYKPFLVFGFLLVFGEMTLAGDRLKERLSSTPDQVTIVNADPETTSENTNNSLSDYKSSQAVYNIPTLQMIDKAGQTIDLRQLFDYGGPVMVQFIFATCPTVCPILSACFSSIQADMEKLSGGVYRLISISIDPEQDTPERLSEYAKRFKADKNWYFLTGSRDDVLSLLKAFDATYRSNNKMYHQSLTLMRPSKDAKWTRIEGLMGKKDLLAEYIKMSGLPPQAKN